VTLPTRSVGYIMSEKECSNPHGRGSGYWAVYQEGRSALTGKTRDEQKERLRRREESTSAREGGWLQGEINLA